MGGRERDEKEKRKKEKIRFSFPSLSLNFLSRDEMEMVVWGIYVFLEPTCSNNDWENSICTKHFTLDARF